MVLGVSGFGFAGFVAGTFLACVDPGFSGGSRQLASCWFGACVSGWRPRQLGFVRGFYALNFKA